MSGIQSISMKSARREILRKGGEKRSNCGTRFDGACLFPFLSTSFISNITVRKRSCATDTRKKAGYRCVNYRFFLYAKTIGNEQLNLNTLLLYLYNIEYQ